MKVRIADFAARFVREMRKKNAPVPPSIREGVAIARMLVVRYFRKGTLIPEDYMDVAVVCSPPENKKLAKKTAFEILLGRERKDYQEIEEIADIESILSEVELAAAMQDISFAKSLEFYEKVTSSTDPKIRNAVRVLGSAEEVFKKGITNEKELLDAAKKRLEEKIGSLTPVEAKFAKDLSLDLSSSPRVWERAVSQGPEVAKNHDAVSMAKTIIYAGMDPELVNELKNKIETIEDLFYYSISTGQPPSEEMISRFCGKDFLLEFSMFKTLDEILGSNTLGTLLNMWPSAPLSLLLQNPVHRQEWYDLFNRSLEEIIKNSEGQYSSLYHIFTVLEHASERAIDPRCKQEIRSKLGPVAEKTLASAPTKEECIRLLREFSDKGISLGEDLIREIGKKHNMSSVEIEQFLNPTYQTIKKSIIHGIGNYPVAKNVLSRTKLSRDKIRNLAKLAIERRNIPWTAALAVYSIETVIQAAKDDDDENFIFAALGAAPGMDIMYLWFYHRRDLPRKTRMKMRELARRVLLNYVVYYTHQYFGTAKRGILPTTTVRPYEWGDDIDLIDIEETIEHIIAQGKKPDDIEPEDLLVRESLHGRKSVFLLLDCSESMDGAPLANMALSAAILIYALPHDEIAISFFGPALYVLKNINEHKSLDEVVESVLSMEAHGGTSIAPAIKWLEENIKNSKTRDRILILLSDCEFYESPVLLSEIKDSISTSITIVPTYYSKSTTTYLKEALKSKVIVIDKWEQLPSKISKIIAGW